MTFQYCQRLDPSVASITAHEPLACVASVSVWFRSKARFLILAVQKMEQEPRNERGGSLTLVPRFLLQNRTETLATWAEKPQDFNLRLLWS